MKNKITNCLIKIILCICCVYFCSNTFVAAQSLDNSPAIVKNFGSSLKKINKKKKDKIEITKQNNVTATITEDEVIRVDTVMVMNEILVLDENGHHIKGLKKEDFVIKEDNEIQEISTFLSGDNEVIPRSIVLIIDYSGSQLPYIETSIEAAKVSVDKLSPKDQMAIVTDNVELLQGFTTDKTLLKNKLESLKIKALSGELSSSKQYSALMATLNEMFDDKTLRPIIIFQTDGDELGILKGELSDSHYPNTDETSFSFKDI